jgi:hypothetical protein
MLRVTIDLRARRVFDSWTRQRARVSGALLIDTRPATVASCSDRDTTAKDTMNTGPQCPADVSTHLGEVQLLDDCIAAARSAVLSPTVAMSTWKLEG